MTELEKHTISRDGTRIGYRQTGRGPGLMICHGGGRISQNYRKLAAALAGSYTVYTPDRRGRGLSGPAGADYDITKASEDMTAVIEATGAEYIFGHSAGGLIALETMLVHPVKKAAVYEPPISVNHSLPSAWLADFEAAIQAGKPKKAMAISLKGLQVMPGINQIPLRLLMIMINALAIAERKKEKGTRMTELLHTLPADMKMAMQLDSAYDRYKATNIPVLLMAGANSPEYFHTGISALKATIPMQTTRIFDGFDHYSPEEKVEELSAALREFYNQ